jgi:hypothetical protein
MVISIKIRVDGLARQACGEGRKHFELDVEGLAKQACGEGTKHFELDVEGSGVDRKSVTAVVPTICRIRSLAHVW